MMYTLDKIWTNHTLI